MLSLFLDNIYKYFMDINSLKNLIGKNQLISEPNKMSAYLNEPRKRFFKKAQAITLPKNVEQVQAIAKWANKNKVAIIPQGGNTGLVGGQVPLSGNEIILSLKNLTSIRELKADHITVEAGLTLQALHTKSEQSKKIFPLTIASEGSAQIGGILASNAGGSQVLAYGNARQLCLGIEAVLADGSLYNGLGSLKKDNTGYDLNNLLIGSEGSLAIITAAKLKLFPKPLSYETALVAFDNPFLAYEFFKHIQSSAQNNLTAFELIPRFGLDIQLKHKMLDQDPSAGLSPWYSLIEISHHNKLNENLLSNELEYAFSQNLIGEATTIAQSEFERENMWKFREQMSECQNCEGASIKHDVSVPVEKVPELIEMGIKAIAKINPNIRPCPFGHMGDGNIHFNFTQPKGMEAKTFMDNAQPIHDAIYEVVIRLNGSISAEHGIGQLKRELLIKTKDKTALAMMKTIKAALDPNNILNPGKILF